MTCTIGQPYLKGDREAIQSLWKRNLPEAVPGRYAWLYEAGPAASWVARDDQDQPTGSIGLMSRTLDVFGESRPAGQPIDLNVDRRWRIGGVALSLQRALIEQMEHGAIDLIYGFPNAQSEPVLRRIGYRAIGEVGRWVKPLAGEAVLPDWVRPSPLRKVISLGCNVALRLFGEEPRRRHADGWRVEVTDRFDARFDRLWEAARAQFSIIGHRDAEYLNWRFVHAPRTCHRVFYLTDAQNELLAYLVYSCRDGNAYVSDFLFRDRPHFETLMAEFTRMMRRERVWAIVTIYSGDPRVARTLARCGFHLRNSAWKILVLADHTRLGAQADAAYNPHRWFLTRADIDTEF
ncbi:MAG: GNAT family N-acetyltransferase [Pirellulales bacterium]|nr:GNAT family N-acetyltransferase [Pirellulales bacterium]